LLMTAAKVTASGLILLLFSLPLAVRADFTAVMGAFKDNSMFENFPNNSAGGAAGIYSGNNNVPAKRRGLVAFNIAGNVPAGSTITGVELSMYLATAPNTNNQTIGLHRMSLDWGENTADTSSPLVNMMGNGVTAMSGDATWNENFFGTSTWPTPGATGSFNAIASGTSVVGGTIDTQKTWLSTATLISDVQGWLDNSATNFGWAIVNANEASNQTMKAFYSRQASLNNGGTGTTIDPSWRPTLTVTYTNSTAPSGDYNGNGIVDAADYVDWRQTLYQSASPAGSGADGNQSGTIDADDHTYWKARFGNPASGFGATAAIPEPATLVLFHTALPLALIRKRR
jgi:hypothetical protein